MGSSPERATCCGKGTDPAQSILLLLPCLAGEPGICFPPPCSLPSQICSVAPTDLCPPWLNRSPEGTGHQAGKMSSPGLLGLGAALSSGRSCSSVAMRLPHAIPLGPSGVSGGKKSRSLQNLSLNIKYLSVFTACSRSGCGGCQEQHTCVCTCPRAKVQVGWRWPRALHQYLSQARVPFACVPLALPLLHLEGLGHAEVCPHPRAALVNARQGNCSWELAEEERVEGAGQEKNMKGGDTGPPRAAIPFPGWLLICR